MHAKVMQGEVNWKPQLANLTWLLVFEKGPRVVQLEPTLLVKSNLSCYDALELVRRATFFTKPNATVLQQSI